MCVSALFLKRSHSAKFESFGFLHSAAMSASPESLCSRWTRLKPQISATHCQRHLTARTFWLQLLIRIVWSWSLRRAFSLFPARTCRQAKPCGLWGLNYLQGGEWTWGCKCLALWASWELHIRTNAPCACGPSTSTHKNEVYLDCCVNILLFTSYYGNDGNEY